MKALSYYAKIFLMLIGLWGVVIIIASCNETNDDTKVANTFSKEEFKWMCEILPTPDVKPVCYWQDESGIDGFHSITFRCNEQTHNQIVKRLGLTLGEFDGASFEAYDKCQWWGPERIKKVKYYYNYKYEREGHIHWNMWYDKERGLIHLIKWNT